MGYEPSMSVQREDVIILELISSSSVYDERRKEVMGLSVVACVLEAHGVRQNGTRHRG